MRATTEHQLSPPDIKLMEPTDLRPHRDKDQHPLEELRL
jgi:hypothetical protein